MKPIIYLFFSISLASCSSGTKYTTFEKVEPYWKDFYSTLISKCLESKGVLLKNPPIIGKPYYYNCSHHELDRGWNNYSGPYTGNIVEGRFALRVEDAVAEKMLLEKKFPVLDYIYREKRGAIYSTKIHYILKNGYTYLTIGRTTEFKDSRGRNPNSAIIQIEGYSSNPHPTHAEIHGTQNDISDFERNIMAKAWRENMEDLKGRETVLNDRHNERVSAEMAREKAERRAKKRRNQEFWGSVARDMANSTNGGDDFGVSDNEFWEEINNTTNQTMGEVNRLESRQRQSAEQRSNTSSQDSRSIPEAYRNAEKYRNGTGNSRSGSSEVKCYGYHNKEIECAPGAVRGK